MVFLFCHKGPLYICVMFTFNRSLHENGIDDLLIYISSSEDEVVYCIATEHRLSLFWHGSVNTLMKRLYF